MDDKPYGPTMPQNCMPGDPTPDALKMDDLRAALEQLEKAKDTVMLCPVSHDEVRPAINECLFKLVPNNMTIAQFDDLAGAVTELVYEARGER